MEGSVKRWWESKAPGDTCRRGLDPPDDPARDAFTSDWMSLYPALALPLMSVDRSGSVMITLMPEMVLVTTSRT